jgi:predicted ATPase with chaperone activity
MGKISGQIFLYPYSGVCVKVSGDSPSLAKVHTGHSSAQMREQVVSARKFQLERFDGTGSEFNSEMNYDQLKKFSRLDRGEHIGRIARTIADLASSEQVLDDHLDEAQRLDATNLLHARSMQAQ